jgi:hypothetical protein
MRQEAADLTMGFAQRSGVDIGPSRLVCEELSGGSG